MDLRSGCSYWIAEKGDEVPEAPALDRDIDANVVIVGGGVTGALASHYLIEAGLDVVLVDRRNLARGSTAASTGLLQYEIDKPLVELRDLVGDHVATRAYQLGKDALDEFARLTTSILDDDCGFARTRSLLLATDDRSVELLRAEANARRAAGLTVDFLPAAELKRAFAIDRPAALLSYEAARVDPVRVTTALLAKAQARGLRAFGRTQVDRYAWEPSRVTMATSAGRTIRARHVIFATGYETPEFLKEIRVTLRSTYACATTPVATANELPLIWETGQPYFYLRPDAGRLIIGGEDDDFADPDTRDARIPQKVRTLERKLHALLPDLRIDAECAWAGTFAETPDSLPYIGPHPEFPGGLFALGYGGNGITFALIAARLIRDRITGRANQDGSLFGFNRGH
jgi:glycine/D-amino acid oxidase-like deaminating enzyme